MPVTLTRVSEHLYLSEQSPDVCEVRGAVIVGRERAVVWDTLLHPDDLAGVAAFVRGRPVSVVYSHADWDHCWGTGGLEALYTEVIGHESCLERFHDESDVEATLAAKIAEDERYRAVRLVPPTRTFREHLTLELGGLTLGLHALPGHTRDCIVGFSPELRVLLGGDAVEAPLPLVYEHSPLGAWSERLEGWLGDRRVRSVVPSHGAVGGRELLERNLAYLRALREGRVPDVGGDLEPFYAAAHEKNLLRAVAGS